MMIQNESVFNIKEKMKRFLVEGKTVSRWTILILDLLIVSWSFSFSFFLVKGFEFTLISPVRFAVYITSFTIIAIITLYVGRMHTGLLRYSNSVDLFRIFSAAITFNIIFLSAMLLFAQSIIDNEYQNLFLIVLINFFISTSLLVMLRVVGRNIYQFLTRRFAGKDFVNVLIYGSDKNAVLVKQALESNQERSE